MLVVEGPLTLTMNLYHLQQRTHLCIYIYIYTPKHLKGEICQNVGISGRRPREGKACFMSDTDFGVMA